MSKPIIFSKQQQDFITWAVEGSGSCILSARAGTGKTFTLLRAARLMPGQVAIMAFNKKIAEEIKAKLKRDGVDWKKAQAGTVHSFGFQAYKKTFPAAIVVGHKVADIIDASQDETAVAYKGLVCKLVSLAKQRAIGVTDLIDNIAAWQEIVLHFDLLSQAKEHNANVDVEKLIATAQKILRASNAKTDVIDFDDMCYLPLVHNCQFWQFDVVIVDEAQDTNPARRAMVRAMVRRGGRVIAVGDPFQAIYGFCHPPKTKVRVPNGWANIEDLKAGDPIVVADTSGNVAGWSGSYHVIQAHTFDYDEEIIDLMIPGATVPVTVHHRVPVKMNPDVAYFTYMMERCGVFRVGYMTAYGKAGKRKEDQDERRFMLSQRCVLEGADKAWILNGHATKEAAQLYEATLLKRMKGTTFNQMRDEDVITLDAETNAAVEILLEHGRRYAFPFWRKGERQDFKERYPFITEACNVMPGMLMTALDEGRWDTRKRGRSRQTFEWKPVEIRRWYYRGKTHGITVPAIAMQDSYSQWPLYFAGGGVLVHNTGADNDSLELIAKDFNATWMPLTVTYRCPKSVVEYAKQWVPDYEAHPSAPEGQILNMTEDALLTDRSQLVMGNAVLCRVTRPLISLAFRMIRMRIPCNIEGRDIAEGLVKLATKWTRVKTIPALEDKLDEYYERQKAKLLAVKAEAALTTLEDQVESLRTIMDQCRLEKKDRVEDVVLYVNELFKDGVENVLVLSTIHKAKGREWKIVFWYDRAGTCPNKWARQAWQQAQERHLQYVACTRAQETLVEVTPSQKAQAKPAENVEDTKNIPQNIAA